MSKSDPFLQNNTERPPGKSLTSLSPSQLAGIESGRLLPISQFSRSTGISRSALIYYDEIGVFHPAKRDPHNHYRYYRPEQIITANLINVLAGLSIPLEQIKKLASERSAISMLELFDKHRDTLQEHLDQLQQSIKLVNVFRSLLSMGADADESKVMIKTIPRWDIIIGPGAIFPPDGNFYPPFLAFCAWAKEHNYPINFPTGGYFPDFERFYDRPAEPGNFFLLLDTNDDSPDTLEVLTAYSRGFYGQTGDISIRMKHALAARKLTPDGPVLCSFIEDEISTIDPSQFLMMATVRIHRNASGAGKEKQ